jgi:ABC-2 type transport system ATP-binding protein
MPVVEIENLTKDYASGALLKKTVRALDDLSLVIEDKEIFGLIGPNGAGKTTTLKLLMGLIFPTSGEARILGQPLGDVPTKLHIGYLPENPYFYDYLTGRELLEYFGQLFGMSRTDRQERVGELLRRVDLLEAADMQLRKYSKGMIQRLGVAQAILNRPRIVFLDEPMSGLDPMGRRDMTRLIQELRDDGVTVVFSSHILPDVESLCDRVAILNKGKLVREGRLVEILDVSVQSIELVVHDLTNDLATELEGRSQRFRRMGRRSHLEFNDAQVVDEVLELLRAKGVRLVSVNPVKQTLEEYFVREVRSEGTVEAEGNNS